MEGRLFVRVWAFFSLLIGICVSMDEHPVNGPVAASPVSISPRKNNNCLCDDSKFSLQIRAGQRERKFLEGLVQRAMNESKRLELLLRNLEQQLLTEVRNLTASLHREVEKRKTLHKPISTNPTMKSGPVKTDPNTNCSVGWVPYPFGDSCYYIHTTKMALNYDAAALECYHRDANLASVETFMEFRFLKTYLGNNYDSVKNKAAKGWIIGANRLSSKWHWESGATFTSASFRWGRRIGHRVSNKNCLGFLKDADFNIATMLCVRQYRQFICEI